MPCLVEIGQVVLKKKYFLKFVNVVSLFPYYLPLEKGVALHLNELDYPSPKGCFVPSLVKIGPVVLKKRDFSSLSMFFLLFRNYLPLEKGGVLHLNKLESQSPKNALCQV